MFIGGSDTALMGCSIGPVEPLIFVQPFTDVTQLGLTTTTTPSTSPVTPEYFKVFTDHCTQSVALSISALYGSGVVGFSQSLFTLDPSQLTSLPSSVVGGAGARVVGIAPTRNTLAVLMSDGGLYYASTATPFQKVGGLPSGLDSIRYIDYCDASNLYASVLNSVTVTWSSSTSVIYVSMNGGLTFNNVTLTNGSGAGQVLDVAVQHTTQSLAVLFRSSSTTTMLNYGLTSGAVTESSATVTNGMTKMVAMAMSEVLVYGSGGVQFR